MKDKLNSTEAVTVLVVIIIGIVVGVIAYNSDDVLDSNLIQNVLIESENNKISNLETKDAGKLKEPETDQVKDSVDADKVEGNSVIIDLKNSDGVDKVKVNSSAHKDDETEENSDVSQKTIVLPSPKFDLFSIDSSGLATIVGKGLAGETLEIIIDGQVIASIVPDQNGEFAIIIDIGKSSKPRSLILRTRHSDGREVFSEETVLITPFKIQEEPGKIIIAEEEEKSTSARQPKNDSESESESETGEESADIQDKDQDVIEGEVSDESEVSVAIVSSEELKVTTPVVQRNAPKVSDVIIDAISYDDRGEVLLTGRGVEDQHIRIYVDNKPIKTQSIEADGTWSLDLQEIDAGVYILRIDQLDSDGVVTSRTETPFQKETNEIAKQMAVLQSDAALEAAPKVGIGLSTVIIQPGYTLWAVARKTYGFGMQYVRIYHANKDQIRDPDLIYPGQIFKLPE